MRTKTTPCRLPVAVVVPSKAELRAKCRAKWGRDWHKVHPVIKKCRLAWATGQINYLQHVTVHDEGGTYVV